MRRDGLALAVTAAAGCAAAEPHEVVRLDLRNDLRGVQTSAAAVAGRLDDFTFEVEPEASALQIELRAPDARFALRSLVDSEGRERVDEITTRGDGRTVGEVAWLVPNGDPLSPPAPGTWTLGVDVTGAEPAWSGLVDVRILAKRAPRDDERCQLRLDIVVADDALHVDDTDLALAELTARVNDVLRAGLVEITDYGVVRMATTDSRIELDAPTSTWPLVERAAETLSDAGLARSGALRVVVARSLGARGVIGYALGLPAAYPLASEYAPSATLLVGSEGFLDPAGYLDVTRVATTMAHEVGHALGLYHTTETDGIQHDPLADTPTCGGVDCGPDFELNLMSPTGRAERNLITPSQARVARHHPLCASR